MKYASVLTFLTYEKSSPLLIEQTANKQQTKQLMNREFIYLYNFLLTFEFRATTKTHLNDHDNNPLWHRY